MDCSVSEVSDTKPICLALLSISSSLYPSYVLPLYSTLIFFLFFSALCSFSVSRSKSSSLGHFASVNLNDHPRSIEVHNIALLPRTATEAGGLLAVFIHTFHFLALSIVFNLRAKTIPFNAGVHTRGGSLEAHYTSHIPSSSACAHVYSIPFLSLLCLHFSSLNRQSLYRRLSGLPVWTYIEDTIPRVTTKITEAPLMRLVFFFFFLLLWFCCFILFG